MSLLARLCAAILLVAALTPLPAGAAGLRRKVLGVVAQADRARIDKAAAQTGADIYACDSLETEEAGTLRVRVGPGQVYLSGLSGAALEDEGIETDVLITRGGIGFAIPISGGLAVRTPAGIVRGANGQAVAGEISLTGPSEMLVSAMRGDLLLDNAGELRTVPEGKSARVTFDAGLANGCRDESADDANNQVKHSIARHKIGFYIIMGAAGFLPSYFIWKEATESDSTPPGF
jgi:hypothetical protein